MSTISRKLGYAMSNWVDAYSEHNPDTYMSQILDEFRDQVKRGLPIDLSPQAISALINAIQHSTQIDDRKFLLEHLLTVLSKMPPGPLYTKMQNAVVMLLFNDLGHPAQTYIGPKYSYRTADGSGNNLSDPTMGAAGTPYSRSVQSTHPQPYQSLPDAGLVFDTLLRREKFEPHPAGLSSCMFAFAALVIHTCFRTDHKDVNINGTSSYVDLSPLYGHDEASLNTIRLNDGLGSIKKDTFAEDRLLLLPPAVCALLVVFSRNHNYSARKIYELNERGWYKDPSTLSPGDLTKQEEDIFQTARLVNCAYFAAIVFSDYFSSILGLLRDGSSWSLNPFEEIRKADHSFEERGQGNVVSVEFNCLYRWHATTSAEDAQWVEYAFGKIFPGKNPDDITPEMFMTAFVQLQAAEPDVSHWTFGGITRGDDDHFKDDELAKIIQNATSHPAARFGARGTPSVMRLHEVMGIESARRWGCCTMNEFRLFLGLKPYASFLEWNSNPEVANTAEKLYGHINNLELYPGLQAEETKPVMPGAGLCPGYTLSRAILSDAMALTRGDRFFTADNTPFNLTAWGYQDCIKDPNNPGFGSMLGRLLLRHLPGQYSEDSVYTWFPLMTPGAMKVNLTKIGVAEKYTFAPPVGKPKVVPVEEYAQVAKVLRDTTTFDAPYTARAKAIVKGKGFFLSGLDSENLRQQTEVLKILGGSPTVKAGIASAFAIHTKDLITQNTYPLIANPTTKCVDIVRDVLRFVPMYWAAETVGLPIKTPGHEGYAIAHLHHMLNEVYEYLFLNPASGKGPALEHKSRLHCNDMLGYIQSSLEETNPNGFSVSRIVGSIHDTIFGQTKTPSPFLQQLHTLGHPIDQLSKNALAVIVAAAPELGQTLINMVNLYIDSPYKEKIAALAVSTDPKASALLEGYAHEALRLAPAFSGVFRTPKVAANGVQPSEIAFLNIEAANLDPSKFENPTEVDPERKGRDLTDEGLTHGLGLPLTTKIMVEVLRAVFSLKNVRRGPGRSGLLARFAHDINGSKQWMYLSKASVLTPWAESMIIQYDL